MNANYVRYLQSRNYSPLTINQYIQKAKDFFVWSGLKDSEVRQEDVMDYIASMSGKANGSINLAISSIKSYFNYLEMIGEVSSNPTRNIKALNPNPKVKPYVSAKDAMRMIECTRTIRDKAILMVMVSNGLRINELVNLKQSDYDTMKANGGNMMVIRGKGRKERTLYLPENIQKVIDQYVQYKKSHACHCDNLFQSFNGGPIQRNNFSNTLKTIAKNAGLPYWEQVSNHTMRAACATVYNEKGYTVPYIQDLLGHSNINTTRRYIKTNRDNIQSMVSHGMDDMFGG